MARKKANSDLPSFDELIIPTVKALKELGGSGTVEEINNKVYGIAKISDDILQIPHGDGGTTIEVDYRLAWSRTYLKKFGLLENSSRGIWALTKAGIDVNKLDYIEIVRVVREQVKPNLPKTKTDTEIVEKIVQKFIEETFNPEEWKERLLNVLYKIKPDAFERLSQRLLRESGFFQVEVTGKAGDGGIDGKGIVRVNGLLSFYVIFQCKRYKGSVTPKDMREFRGAMIGRDVKGLFITTGTFTKEAIKEATRDGAPPIDLVDGNLLCDKLKEFNLGVETKLTETVEIKNEWLKNL
ncbi:MAG: restriction endonuclease [Bacteroidia bacterium]